MEKDPLAAALDSAADEIDSPDFDHLLSQALDDNADEILGNL